MNTFVLLNGRYVDATDIDPAKHKFIGIFRPSVNSLISAQTDILCTCGEILRYRSQGIEHYRNGCCDINQYVDIGIP